MLHTGGVRIRVYVDDSPGKAQIAVEIDPVVLCHVTSRAQVYRICRDHGVPREEADRCEDINLLPRHDTRE